MMAVDETITGTTDAYVSVSVRLARDLPWRMTLRDRISRSKHRIYRDTACVTALQDFLNSAARRSL
jgi:hypothetical protein